MQRGVLFKSAMTSNVGLGYSDLVDKRLQYRLLKMTRISHSSNKLGRLADTNLLYCTVCTVAV